MGASGLASAADPVGKSVFAGLINVTPGRVSQYIAEGKIFGEAIVGEGRHAKICVEVAKAQLRRKLDIDQRHGNGLSTRLEPGLPLASPIAPSPQLSPADPVEEKIKQERLEALQRQNRKAAEEEAARAGRYAPAEQIAQQFGRIAQDMLTGFEGALSDFATAISAQFNIPHRDVLHLLRSEFRKTRQRASDSLQAGAAALPSFIEGEDAVPLTSERVVVDGDHASECRAPGDGGDGIGAASSAAN